MNQYELRILYLADSCHGGGVFHSESRMDEVLVFGPGWGQVFSTGVIGKLADIAPGEELTGGGGGFLGLDDYVSENVFSLS